MSFFRTKPETKISYLDKAVLAVSKARCPQNHLCPSVRVCPTGALKQTGYAAPVVDEEKCVKCGSCVDFCPRGALSFEPSGD